MALGRDDYTRYVLPCHQALFDGLGRSGVPLIHFSTGTSAYLDKVAAVGGDVISVDWRMPVDWCWKRLDHGPAIQGNLDPAVLLGPWRETRCRTDAILAQAAARRGHIFNLGHGVLPQMSADSLQRLVDHVHERTTVIIRQENQGKDN